MEEEVEEGKDLRAWDLKHSYAAVSPRRSFNLGTPEELKEKARGRVREMEGVARWRGNISKSRKSAEV